MKQVTHIRNIFLSLVFIIIAFVKTEGQEEYRVVTNEAFDVGEHLKWRFYYDSWLAGITAGYGEAEVKDYRKKFDDRSVYHIDTKGYTKGMFNVFFKVRDEFDSYVDKGSLAPHYFTRKTREGGYKKDDEYTFNQKEQKVTNRNGTYDTPPYAQDFISALYYARSFDTDTLEIGDIIPVDFFLDDSVYTSAIVFEGRDTVEIQLGIFKCLRFRPGMATGEVFSNKYPMTLWVSDDKNHLPILGKSAVVVGNLKAELMEFKNLANPLTSLVELKE